MALNATGLVGRYQILAEIGRGAMGVVYKAHDPKIDRIVALKTISLFDLAAPDEAECRARFYEEARAAGRLSHPGIVTVFDVDTNPEDGKPFIVMEYVDGKSINKVLVEHQGRLPLAMALTLAQEIAEALNVAHSQGVVHRDIKPENILVTADGHAKIADFGIACLDQGHLTLPGRILGSPAYMSPEQLNGEHTDARSDLFSLGVVLYTMLTGHRPFQGNSTATVCFKVANKDPLPISSWNLDFPRELDELVARAMSKNPDERFQTGLEMARELQHFRETHEAEVDQPVASIMRIIGQESAAIAETVIAERKSDSDTWRSFGPVAPVLPTASQKSEQLTTAPAARIAKKGVPSPALGSRFALATGAAVAAAGVLFVGALVVHSKHKDTQATEVHSAAIPASAATTSRPTDVSPQPDIANDAAEDSSAEHNSAELAPHVRRARVSRPTAPPPSAQDAAVVSAPPPHRVTAAPRILARADTSAAGKVEPVASPESVTVNMIHLSDLNVTIEHSFDEAQASISVDNRTVYTEELRGEKKRRALVFSHTRGSQSKTITLLPGKHDILVRVQSPNGYDATETVTHDFSPGSSLTLLVKCDKRKNRLELDIK